MKNKLIIISLLLLGCSNPSTNNGDNLKNEPSKSNDCACSDFDVQSLANKIVNDFTTTQNELPSELARVMEINGPVDKRDNCTWVVRFKISYPFGNTDGAHPDQYITKRFGCDGKQVYAQ